MADSCHVQNPGGLQAALGAPFRPVDISCLDASEQTAALNCGFNRWPQHLSSDYRAGGVVDEAKTEDLLLAGVDSTGVESLAGRRFPDAINMNGALPMETPQCLSSLDNVLLVTR
jgi:hypothetical protein